MWNHWPHPGARFRTVTSTAGDFTRASTVPLLQYLYSVVWHIGIPETFDGFVRDCKSDIVMEFQIANQINLFAMGWQLIDGPFLSEFRGKDWPRHLRVWYVFAAVADALVVQLSSAIVQGLRCPIPQVNIQRTRSNESNESCANETHAKESSVSRSVSPLFCNYVSRISVCRLVTLWLASHRCPPHRNGFRWQEEMEKSGVLDWWADVLDKLEATMEGWPWQPFNHHSSWTLEVIDHH